MKSRNNGYQCLLWLFSGVVLALGQAVSAAPNIPGHIEVGKVTATTAVVHWGAPVVEEGVHVFYDVQLRRRIEGKPTDWDHAAETAKTEVALRHLKPGTIYEVRVRGWVNKKPSAWWIKENAFTTLVGHDGDGEGDHGEGEGNDDKPSGGEHGGEVDLRLAWVKGGAGKYIAAIWWQLMGDAETELAYDVQLRPRIEGKAGEWEHAAETNHREVKVDGLKAGTLYEVRVRAGANKTPGPWQIKENTFTTGGGEGEQTIDNAGHVDFQVIPGSKMRLTWPAGKGRFVVESADSIGGSAWTAVDIRPVQVSQMMLVDLPIGESGMRFFRVRN